MNNTIWVIEQKKQIINGSRKNVIQIFKYSKKDFVFQKTYSETFLYQDDPKWLIKLKKKLNMLAYGNIFAKEEGKMKRREIHNEIDLENYLTDVGIDITKTYGYSGNTI